MTNLLTTKWATLVYSSICLVNGIFIARSNVDGWQSILKWPCFAVSIIGFLFWAFMFTILTLPEETK